MSTDSEKKKRVFILFWVFSILMLTGVLLMAQYVLRWKIRGDRSLKELTAIQKELDIKKEKLENIKNRKQELETVQQPENSRISEKTSVVEEGADLSELKAAVEALAAQTDGDWAVYVRCVDLDADFTVLPDAYIPSPGMRDWFLNGEKITDLHERGYQDTTVIEEAFYTSVRDCGKRMEELNSSGIKENEGETDIYAQSSKKSGEREAVYVYGFKGENQIDEGAFIQIGGSVDYYISISGRNLQNLADAGTSVRNLSEIVYHKLKSMVQY